MLSCVKSQVNRMNDYSVLSFQEVKEEIARYCHFSLGRELLSALQPSDRYLWIQRESACVQEAMELTIRYGRLSLPALYNIHASLEDARRDKALRPIELNRIAAQGRAVHVVQAYRKASEVETPCLNDLCHSLQDITSLVKEIERCINAHDEILDQASTKLAGLRRSIRMCEADISKEVQRFMAANSSKLMDTISTTRSGRVCVLIKDSEKNSVQGFVHGVSASGQAAYVEPAGLLALNNKLASLNDQLQEEMERILWELSQRVKEHYFALEANQESFALLDSYFARAQYAQERDGCIAAIKEHGARIYLKEARHPLIDPKRAVANTYEMNAPYRTLLITGSNTGGKTVTLKTIGLAACLAQSALPILAQEAQLPLFSHIFADIGDEQSIQESLSTFSAHVSKLAYIIEHASAHALILLDELGSGTDPKEGESLAIAVLEELHEARSFVLATTHYSALKTYAKQQNDVLIATVEFDVEAMKPTYRYLAGISGSSNAFAIARRYHMKERVLTRAEQIKRSQQTKQDQLMDRLEMELAHQQVQRQQMEQTQAEIETLRESLIKQQAQYDKVKEKELAQLKAQYEERMDAILHAGEAIVAELKALDREVKPHVVEALAYQLHHVNDDVVEEVPRHTAQPLHIGDRVTLAGLHAHGEIIELNKDKAVVLVNGVRMNIKQKDLTLIAPMDKVKKSKERGYGVQRTTTHFSMELNVIGMQVQEALPIIDKYLDNAILAKLTTVRIIHGNGTGALRKGVHQFLKRHPKVVEFRLGGQGEGGTGATVVALKQRGKSYGKYGKY